jgi:spermidine/putrescine ABC transporter ATP-binding subunit
MTTYQLNLSNVLKTFGNVLAVDNVSLNIKQGEFLTLLGPSGSGKTTTLNMIAGFEIPTSGKILLESRDITTVQPKNRGIGMVFQNYALFPHMTVFDNIAFPLKMRKAPADEIHNRIKATLELVQLPHFENRYPNQLSGGQQQRIALARALVFQPPILLMDEPLGALDKKLRDHMRLEIKHLHESLHITIIYVTHDQEEALTMSDRIAIMNQGRIIQLDTPVGLYESPLSWFVADFIGESNFLQGKVIKKDDEKPVVETEHGLRLWVKERNDLIPGKKVTVAIRPEKIQILQNEAENSADIVNRFPGMIEEIVYVGEAMVYRIKLAQGLSVTVKVQSGPLTYNHKPKDEVMVGWRARHSLALN